MLANLNSIQSTIKDLKEIVAKNQGTNHETIILVRQMEQLVSDIETKAKTAPKKSNHDLPLPAPVVT